MSNAIEPQARAPSLRPTMWKGRNPFSLYFILNCFYAKRSNWLIILLYYNMWISFRHLVYGNLLKHVRTPSSVVFSGVSFWEMDFFLKPWKKSPGKSPFWGARRWGKFSLYYQYKFSIDKNSFCFSISYWFGCIFKDLLFTYIKKKHGTEHLNSAKIFLFWKKWSSGSGERPFNNLPLE